MIDILLDAFLDTAKLIPFLFLTYLLMEFIEHKTGEKTKKLILKSGKVGPLAGGILGIVPQCGFSAAAASLYAGKIITTGTLVAIFLSTSDEMLPVMISEKAPLKMIFLILFSKILIGVVSGFLIDIIFKRKDIYTTDSIKETCEHEHCHCERGIFFSSIIHTIHIALFILIITVILNGAIFFIGEENIASIILSRPVIGQIISALIGLIPNCASSVVITKLFLDGLISAGSMLSGLLVGSGVGILVLLRTNKNIKENLSVIFTLLFIGIFSGIVCDLLNLGQVLI